MRARNRSDQFGDAAVHPGVTPSSRRNLAWNSPLLAFALATGCNKLDEYNPFGSAEAAPVTASPAAPAVEVAELTTTEVAYASGRKWAFSSLFAFLGEEASSAETYAQASAAAKRLGLTLPPKAAKDDALDKLRGIEPTAELETKHGVPVALSFALGAKLTESTLAVELGSDAGKLFDDIELAATRAQVPKASFEKELGALRTTPSRDTAQALSKAFDTYFRYEDAANGKAWTSTGAPAPARVP